MQSLVNIQSHSHIIKIILDEIARNGPISFDKYLDLALYHKEYGYYMNAKSKFGFDGDFTTAPSFSNLFGSTLASFFLTNEPSNKIFDILEFGAGGGHLCLSILKFFEKTNKLDNIRSYQICEISTNLKKQQLCLFKENLSQDSFKKINFTNQVPKCYSGIIIANEFLDALVFKRYKYQNNQVFEAFVDYVNKQLQFTYNKCDFDIEKLLKDNSFKDDLYFEHSNEQIKWLKQVYDNSNEVKVYLIDYGMEEQFYYSHYAPQGSMRCFYKNTVNNNPFVNVGLQDITYSINFTSVAQNASKLGFNILNFSSLDKFLISAGIDKIAFKLKNDFERINAICNMKVLLNPEGFGNLFKILTISKNK